MDKFEKVGAEISHIQSMYSDCDPAQSMAKWDIEDVKLRQMLTCEW